MNRKSATENRESRDSAERAGPSGSSDPMNRKEGQMAALSGWVAWKESDREKAVELMGAAAKGVEERVAHAPGLGTVSLFSFAAQPPGKFRSRSSRRERAHRAKSERRNGENG